MFTVPPGERQLFIDDVGVASVENLQKTMHPPVKKGAVIRPDLAIGVDSIQTHSAPIWDPETECFKYWIYEVPVDLHEKGIGTAGYYESEDGLHWTKPAMGQVEHRGSRDNNLVTVQGMNRGFENAVYDPIDPDPACRYKGFAHNHNVLYPIASDGVTWRKLDCPAIPSWDSHEVYFDPVEKLFIAYVKDAGSAAEYDGPWKKDATANLKGDPGSGRYGRSVWLTTSTDFRHWTPVELIFETDDLDQELAKENIAERLANPSLQQPVANDPTYYNADIGGIHLTGVRRDPHQCSAADRHGRFAPGRSRLVGCPRRLGGSGGSFLGRRLAMRSWKRIGSWATASSSTR